MSYDKSFLIGAIRHYFGINGFYNALDTFITEPAQLENIQKVANLDSKNVYTTNIFPHSIKTYILYFYPGWRNKREENVECDIYDTYIQGIYVYNQKLLSYKNVGAGFVLQE